MVGDILQPTHLLLILVVALLVLGPKRLPEVGRSLGRGLRDFRSALTFDDNEREMFSPMTVDTPATAATATAAPATTVAPETPLTAPEPAAATATVAPPAAPTPPTEPVGPNGLS